MDFGGEVMHDNSIDESLENYSIKQPKSNNNSSII